MRSEAQAGMAAPPPATSIEEPSHAERVGIGRRIAAFLVGTGIALLLAELVVRQVYDVPWAIDPEFGCIVQPGTKIHYRLEGDGVSCWTEHGVRATTPPDPTHRPILVLGDSFTEAYQVNDTEAYPHRLEEELRAARIDVDVVNAGRSAASPADYAADAARNRRYFDPRWVVIQLNEDDLTGDAWSPDKAHFVVEGDRLVAKPAPAKTQSTLARAVWRARQHSALLNYSIIRLQQFARASTDAPPLFFGANARPPRPPARTYDDADVAAQLAAVADAYAGRVTFLLLPTLDLVRPRDERWVERAFHAACTAHGWSCVSLRETYERFASAHLSPFGFPNSGFNVGHMNASGHRAAAELLTRELLHLRADALF